MQEKPSNYQKYKEYYQAYQKEYRKTHKGYFARKGKEWRMQNAEKVKEQERKRYWRNPEKRRATSHNSRFKRHFGSLELRNFILQRDNETCQLCGITREEHRKKYGKDIAIDHVDGSGFSATRKPNNDPSNLRVLCIPCNLQMYKKMKYEKQKKQTPISR